MAEVKRYLTPVFRGSFVHQVFKAESYEGGEPKYGLTAIWTPGKFSAKDKERWRTIMAALDDEAKSRFKKSIKDLKALNAEGDSFKLSPRDGKTKADLEGFGEGTVFASLTTKMRPGVVDKDKNPISHEEGNTDEVYSGAYYRATVTVYSYQNKGKGVALGLMNLQKVADGERIDGRTDAAADFEDELDDAWMEEGEDEVDPLD